MREPAAMPSSVAERTGSTVWECASVIAMPMATPTELIRLKVVR